MKSIKEGVSTVGLRPEILIAWDIADQIYTELGLEFCTLTSGTDGIHGRSSRHYIGLGIDLRTRDFPNGGNNSDLVTTAVEMLKERLGNEYDIVRESNHLHIEHDLKRK